MTLIDDANFTGRPNSFGYDQHCGSTVDTSIGTITDNQFTTRGFQEDRLIGATISVTDDGTGDTYTAMIAAYNTTTGIFTLDNDNISASGVITDSDLQTNGYSITYARLQDINAELNDGGNGIQISDQSNGDQTFRIDDMNGNVAKQLQIESTMTNAAVKFNPLEITNDVEGTSRTSSLFLGKESLPVCHCISTYWSRASVVFKATQGSDTSTLESARIIAFEAAQDDYLVSDVDATASIELV